MHMFQSSNLGSFHPFIWLWKCCWYIGYLSLYHPSYFFGVCLGRLCLFLSDNEWKMFITDYVVRTGRRNKHLSLVCQWHPAQQPLAPQSNQGSLAAPPVQAALLRLEWPFGSQTWLIHVMYGHGIYWVHHNPPEASLGRLDCGCTPPCYPKQELP